MRNDSPEDRDERAMISSTFFISEFFAGDSIIAMRGSVREKGVVVSANLNNKTIQYTNEAGEYHAVTISRIVFLDGYRQDGVTAVSH